MAGEGNFEWTFAVDSLDGPGDSRIDRLYDQLDAAVDSHAGLTLVTVTAEGATAVDAARGAIRVLVDSGFVVTRSHPDLATRPEISERAAVSRQAVSHWLNGKRHSEPFPPPFNATGGGVWLWSDVDAWLARNVKDVSGGLRYPTFNDHVLIDVSLRTWRGATGPSVPYAMPLPTQKAIMDAAWPSYGGGLVQSFDLGTTGQWLAIGGVLLAESGHDSMLHPAAGITQVLMYWNGRETIGRRGEENAQTAAASTDAIRLGVS
jgi:predicted DNA-binding transcriptional regulator AlpA